MGPDVRFRREPRGRGRVTDARRRPAAETARQRPERRGGDPLAHRHNARAGAHRHAHAHLWARRFCDARGRRALPGAGRGHGVSVRGGLARVEGAWRRDARGAARRHVGVVGHRGSRRGLRAHKALAAHHVVHAPPTRQADDATREACGLSARLAVRDAQAHRLAHLLPRRAHARRVRNPGARRDEQADRRWRARYRRDANGRRGAVGRRRHPLRMALGGRRRGRRRG
mmetsp:Transcript_10579/g.28156  ORF Transcript_10579/g.28156 Transcript_10579/m.28156 type:complete len:228 (+) Transcript_10579:165-848(+)